MEPIEIPELSGFEVPTTPDELLEILVLLPADMRLAAARDLSDKKLVLISMNRGNSGDSHRSPLGRWIMGRGVRCHWPERILHTVGAAPQTTNARPRKGRAIKSKSFAATNRLWSTLRTYVRRSGGRSKQ